MKHTLKLFFILLLLYKSSLGVTSYIDSLKAVYSGQNSKQKLETGLLICQELIPNPPEMLNFSLELLEYSKMIRPDPMIMARVYRNVCDGYYYSDSIARSSEYLLMAISVAENSNPVDTLFLARAYNDLGMNLNDQENRYSGSEYIQKAIDLFGAVGSKDDLADAKSNLATVFYYLGDFESAIKLYQDVYEIDLETGNIKSQSSSLNNLGRMFVEMGKYDTGLDYYKESLALLDTIADRRIIGVRYNNIGLVFQLLGKHREAITWINKAMDVDRSENNLIKVANRQLNLANSYLALKDYQNAGLNLARAEITFQEQNLYSKLSKVYLGYGQLNVLTGDYNQAENYFLNALEMAKTSHTIPDIEEAHKKLYEFYKSTGDYQNALLYLELHKSAEDSLFNLKVSKQIEELEARYLNQKKEAEINRLETENIIRQKELQFRISERNWAFAGLVVFAAFLAGLFWLFTTVQKQKSMLANQNQDLARLNQMLNRLFGIISHDLRNVIGAFQSSSRVIGYHLRKGQPEKLIPLAPEIEKNASNLSEMLENLLNWSVMKIKGIEPVKSLIPVKDRIDKIIEMLHENAERKSNKFVVNIDNEHVWCDSESFNLIFRNIIGNAVKFTSNGTISISSIAVNSHTKIIIRDTGCGMIESMATGLFNPGALTKRKGSSGENGTGLGLQMTVEHLTLNDGTIEVQSKVNEGTQFIITLPTKPL